MSDVVLIVFGSTEDRSAQGLAGAAKHLSHDVQTLVVDPSRRVYRIGPLTVPPGDHALVFHPAEMPAVASALIHDRDPRRLSFALGTWTWTVRGDEP